MRRSRRRQRHGPAAPFSGPWRANPLVLVPGGSCIPFDGPERRHDNEHASGPRFWSEACHPRPGQPRCHATREARPQRKHLERRMRAEAPCPALHPSRRWHLPVLRARLLQRPRPSPGRRAGDMQPLSVPAEARRSGEAPALQGLRPAAERRASVRRAGLSNHAHRTVFAVPGLFLQPPPGQPRHAGAGRTGLGTPPCLHVRALLETTTPLVAGQTCLDN